MTAYKFQTVLFRLFSRCKNLTKTDAVVLIHVELHRLATAKHIDWFSCGKPNDNEIEISAGKNENWSLKTSYVLPKS